MERWSKTKGKTLEDASFVFPEAIRTYAFTGASLSTLFDLWIQGMLCCLCPRSAATGSCRGSGSPGLWRLPTNHRDTGGPWRRCQVAWDFCEVGQRDPQAVYTGAKKSRAALEQLRQDIHGEVSGSSRLTVSLVVAMISELWAWKNGWRKYRNHPKPCSPGLQRSMMGSRSSLQGSIRTACQLSSQLLVVGSYEMLQTWYIQVLYRLCRTKRWDSHDPILKFPSFNQQKGIAQGLSLLKVQHCSFQATHHGSVVKKLDLPIFTVAH